MPGGRLDRNILCLRARVTMIVDRIEVRLVRGEDDDLLVRGDIWVVDIHRPQDRLARGAKLQHLCDNGIQFDSKVETADRRQSWLSGPRKFLTCLVVCISEVISTMSQVAISEPET